MNFFNIDINPFHFPLRNQTKSQKMPEKAVPLSTPHAGKGGKGLGGKGLGGKGGLKRHRKLLRDNIQGITKPAIRRLARRGGVKRISGSIYDEVRSALKARLVEIVHDCIIHTEYRMRKTVTIGDVLQSLKRLGQPIYGFDDVSGGGGTIASRSQAAKNPQYD
ncbi:histone-fold-containing protein [Hypoxylon fragiforme]|uniref:histone-fold-containing protein n=1 Tax=Hypoxylon fragiforme TaxID=63214 RepID=UPI0020C64B53|nr:histone-fold-containing protein [Hypoxylon fragiforme]KAI2606825.1 histone-fold-containing protein [Hypoxylon fragiforme]